MTEKGSVVLTDFTSHASNESLGTRLHLSDYLTQEFMGAEQLVLAASFQGEAQGRRMFWLIKSDLATTGKRHLGN